MAAQGPGEGARIAGFVLAAAALTIAVVVLGPRLLGVAAGPEVELITQLKTAESKGLSIATDAGLLVGTARYQRISSTIDLPNRRAVINATLDFTGQLGATQVSSLGAEQVRFTFDGSDWTATDGLAPTLVSVLGVLEARRAAIEHGAEVSDGGWSPETAELLKVTRRQYGVRGWFVRAEKDQVTVREEYRLRGELPQKPVDERGIRVLELKASAEGFFFADGRL